MQKHGQNCPLGGKGVCERLLASKGGVKLWAPVVPRYKSDAQPTVLLWTAANVPNLLFFLYLKNINVSFLRYPKLS